MTAPRPVHGVDRPRPVRGVYRARPVRGVASGHRRGRAEPESGQVTLFMLGFCLVLLTALAGVAAASSVYVTRRSLSSVADGAAVAAADAVRESDILGGAAPEDRRLDGSAAEAAAGAAIDQSGAPGSLAEFAWSARLDDAGRAAVVTASAVADVPLMTSLFGRGVRVTVSARATGRA